MIRVLFLLILITVVGAYIRFVNISPYKFYPDSYQNLLVARNITEYKSVAGSLGTNGTPYPPYFMWSRPIYPILIVLTNNFLNNWAHSAQFISYFFGVLAIVATYFLGKNIFESRFAGIVATFLIAISFNHIVWSGFIMSDTVGIFFLIVFFSLLFLSIKKTSKFLDFKEMLIGIVFSLAVFSRYEYILFVIPTLYLILIGKKTLVKLVNIFSSFLLTSTIILVSLFPIKDSILPGVTQFPNLIQGAAFALGSFIILYTQRLRLQKFEVRFNIFKKVGYVFIFLSIAPFLLNFLNRNIPVIVGLGNFIKTDFLLSSLAFLGIGLMLQTKEKRSLGIFILIYLLLMEWVYFRINPLQQRYHTHLIPVLVIAATYSILHIQKYLKEGNLAKFRPIYYIFLFIAVVIQISFSFSGIKNWHSGDWTRQSYEEFSAITLNNLLGSDEFLIASLPEPYFFFTNHPTRSVSVDPPYVYLEGLAPNRNLIIINDMAMRDIFPKFSTFIENNLSNYKLTEFKTGKNYHYRFNSYEEKYPVEVYKIKVSELLNKL